MGIVMKKKNKKQACPFKAFQFKNFKTTVFVKQNTDCRHNLSFQSPVCKLWLERWDTI